MGGTIIFSTGDPSRAQVELDSVIETPEYGKVKKVGINEDGVLTLETERATLTLKPELPEPSGGDLPGAVDQADELSGLFALLGTLAQTMREMKAAGRAVREAEHQAQMEKMLEVAEKIRSDGVGALVGTIVGAVVTVGMTVASIAVAVKSASADYNRSLKQADVDKLRAVETQHTVNLEVEKAKVKPDDSVIQKLTTAKDDSTVIKAAAEATVEKLGTTAGKWSIASQMSQVMTQLAPAVLQGMGQFAQADSQADQEVLRKEGEEHQFKAQKEGEQINALDELHRSIMDKLKTILELKARSMEATRV